MASRPDLANDKKPDAFQVAPRYVDLKYIGEGAYGCVWFVKHGPSCLLPSAH